MDLGLADRAGIVTGAAVLYLLSVAVVDADAVGKRYPPTSYAVGREKIVEYALAVGETNPLHLDVDAARDAGYADLVAPPMFAVIYQLRGASAPMLDPEVGLDLAHLLHAGQDFRWGSLVIAGDEVTTTVSVDSISERAGLGFYAFAAESINQRGEVVATGLWRNVVRPEGGMTEVGDEFSLAVTPDRYLTVRYAGASGDFNPIHIDDEFARSVGLPGKILHGLWSMAQVARAHTEAFGGPRTLAALSVEFRAMGVPEHEIRVQGKVIEVDGAIIRTAAEATQDGTRIVRRAQAEVRPAGRPPVAS